MVRHVLLEVISLAQWMNGRFSPDFWDSEPMAITLSQAWQGFPQLKRFWPSALEARDSLLQLAASSPPPQETAYSSYRLQVHDADWFPK